MERVRQVAVERPTVVAVAPEVRSAGLGTELVGRAVDTDLLLAEAGELLAARGNATIQRRSAIGDPAVTLIDVAREVTADLIIVAAAISSLARCTARSPSAPCSSRRVTCSWSPDRMLDLREQLRVPQRFLFVAVANGP